MFHYLQLFITCCLLAFSISSSAQAMTQEEIEHTKATFLFSDRKQWSDALSHADNSNDKVLQTLIKWQYLLDVDSGASFSEIKEFITTHPDWPEQKKLRIRAEMILPESNVPDDEIIEWFSVTPPFTGVGKVALANALQKTDAQSAEKIEPIIRGAWRDGDFNETQEKSLLVSYGNIIKKEDDIARTDRLLWEGKITPAERMFLRVDEKRQKLYKARIALQADKKDAPKLLSNLSSDVKNDIGLLYDRLSFRAKRDDDSGVLALLLIAPKKVPYPEKWWKFRERKIREAMSDGHIALAARLLDNHGQEEGQGLADASWLKGRLLLEYKKHPKDAYQIFYKMFSVVKYPVSKSRAAYWAAKAAKQAGDIDAEKSWLNTASSYPTTFYGQLASVVYNGTAPLRIPAPPIIHDDEREEFNARGIVRAVKLCINSGELGLAGKLINHLVTDADNDKEALLASELGVDAGRTYLSVRGAKKALQNNVVIIGAGYPIPKTPENLELPRSLTLSITRQESEFDNLAKSPSGALGMMQLLPSTAKETAHKNDIGYDIKKLYEPEYNMTLGSLYLQRMIDNYDGSVVMAIAAYNGGPGNVYKWVQKFGKPENSIDGAVDWIENIPFAETRNYVQRVLENLQVYRYIEAQNSTDSDAAKLLLGQDLLR